MRNLNLIVVHCSATKEGANFDAEDVTRWHKAKGWSDCGYHYVIKLDGTLEQGRPIQRIGAHAKGFNNESIGICYIGGVDSNGKPKDTRTEAQTKTLENTIRTLRSVFGELEVKGHKDLPNVAKACPSFDVKLLNL